MGSVMYKTADMTQMSASHYLNFESYLNMLQAGACIDNDCLSCIAIFGHVLPRGHQCLVLF